MFDPAGTKSACIDRIRAYCGDGGCPAVVGISGGMTSAVAAALCKEALGRERVVGILMPDCVQKDLDLAMLTVRSLGIRHEIINIMDAVSGAARALPFRPDVRTRRELARHIRPMVLHAVSSRHNGRTIPTARFPRADFQLSDGEMASLGRLCGLPGLLLKPS